MFPHYSYPPDIFISLVANIFLGGQRSFRADARACISLLHPPLRLHGVENIPTNGPCLLTFNHYYRRGFHAWWLALGMAATIPEDIHFTMTSELTYPGKWYALAGKAISRWLLRRLSTIYSFTITPPMPPRPGDVENRAQAVRCYLAHARSHPRAFLGLAPEGRDNPPTGELVLPAPGTGRFIALLAKLGFPILPVGAYEEAGEFQLNFGSLYQLGPPPGMQVEARDQYVSKIVMSRIATQLPFHLRGPFR